LLEAVDWCLTMDQMQRPQTVDKLLEVFNRPYEQNTEEEPASLLDRLGLKLPWPRR
jgi:hypothetical protein